MDEREIPEEIQVPSRRRRRSPRRLIKGLAFLAICGGVMSIIVYSPLFTLQRVVLHGNAYLNEEDILTSGRLHKGEPLFQLETDEVTQNLMKDLRIESAVVRRRVPDTLEIELKERLPVATVACDYGYLEVGRGGIVLDAHRNLSQIPVPIVSGVEVSDLFVGDTAENQQLSQVLDFLDKLNRDTATSIAEINISDPNNVMVYMNHSVQLKMGALDSLQKKLEITESVNREVKQAKHPIDYVDARFDGSYSIKLKE